MATGSGKHQLPVGVEHFIGRAARVWAKHGQPPDVAAPEESDLADYAYRLALTSQLWVHRRVETFEFLDAETVRRRASLDFEMPPNPSFQPGQEVLVPIMLLRKQDLRNFSVRDGGDAALTVLTAAQNAAIATAGLRQYLEGLGDVPGPLSHPELDAIEQIVGGRCPEKAKRAATEALAHGGALAGAVARETVAEKRADLRALIEQLGDGFMVLVRLSYRPGHRQIVKLSYDAPHATRPLGAVGYLYWLPVRILSTFGLVARQEVFRGLLVGFKASYHAEVVPPLDAYSAETSLEAGRDVVIDDHRYRPHAKISGRARGDTGTLTVLLHASREALIVPLLVSAWITAGTLHYVHDRAAKHELDGQTLAALLLVPFALAAYYVRSSENRYVTKMLRGVRAIAVVPVAAGALIIAMIGLEYLDAENASPTDFAHALEWSGRGASWAWWAAIALSVATVAPWGGSAMRPIVRRLQARARAWSRVTRFSLLLFVVTAIAVAIWLIRPWGWHPTLPI
ncbi:MAG TPA: hypothetical protein VF257_00405 [Solirubrobacteraceae bacterium]